MFTDIVPSEFVLVAHRYTGVTRYVMAPAAMPVALQHNDLPIKETFMVSLRSIILVGYIESKVYILKIITLNRLA